MKSMLKSSQTAAYLSLAIAFVCFIGNSAKWSIPISAWLGIAAMLYFIRQVKWWKGLLFGSLITFAAALIANWGVIPFPLPVMLIILSVSSLLTMLPYLLDKWLAGAYPSFLSTLIFPAAFTVLDFWAATNSAAGTWGNIAYTQYAFTPLFQLASVTGIWGIGFLIYWFGSTANYVLERWGNRSVWPGTAFYAAFLLAAISYGTVRLQVAKGSDAPRLKVAAISVENLSLLERMYFAETGEEIEISPDAGQQDPHLQKAQATVAQFVENPAAPRFNVVHEEAHRLMDQLLALSKEAVEEGAQLIAWSEGVLMTGKPQETSIIERARAFAREYSVYLYLPIASFLPGDVEDGKPFLENKILVIHPSGEILDIYFKNRPVPGEPSIPGDGELPIIEAPNGRFSHAICYDADFTDLMDQLHEKGAQLLVLPSGDWSAISPYHSYMAVARSIENGTALLRPVSKGLSIATDPWGRVLATDDYFEDDRHYLTAAIPMAEVRTLYAGWGNWLVYSSTVLFLLGCLPSFWSRWKSR
ncbi:MAG: nitrilase-related carbon-nitrogen hydrolase [Saprospiraceae bacterium]|nr:nitrilase-related carbon-nitrogen hydrolase [Saprospiraceae bacterium]